MPPIAAREPVTEAIPDRMVRAIVDKAWLALLGEKYPLTHSIETWHDSGGTPIGTSRWVQGTSTP